MNQGKRKEQIEFSEKMAAGSMLGMIIIIIIASLNFFCLDTLLFAILFYDICFGQLTYFKHKKRVRFPPSPKA